MPYIIRGDSPTWGLNDHRYLEQNHDYKYPIVSSLTWYQFHNKICDLIWSRVREPGITCRSALNPGMR